MRSKWQVMGWTTTAMVSCSEALCLVVMTVGCSPASDSATQISLPGDGTGDTAPPGESEDTGSALLDCGLLESVEVVGDPIPGHAVTLRVSGAATSVTWAVPWGEISTDPVDRTEVVWQLPDDIQWVEELPMTATGKVSKLNLRQKFADYKLPEMR